VGPWPVGPLITLVTVKLLVLVFIIEAGRGTRGSCLAHANHKGDSGQKAGANRTDQQTAGSVQ
jgi:hypothetical protein